jgi:hypothetical protein
MFLLLTLNESGLSFEILKDHAIIKGRCLKGVIFQSHCIGHIDVDQAVAFRLRRMTTKVTTCTYNISQ